MSILLGCGFIRTPFNLTLIGGLCITGNVLMANAPKECLEAARRAAVKLRVAIRSFEGLPAIYDRLNRSYSSYCPCDCLPEASVV